MSGKSNLFKSGIWFVRSLLAVLIAALLLLGTDRPSSDYGVVAADFFEWNSLNFRDVDAGSYGYLRQLPDYQKKDGDGFSFYAEKSILVFGEGEVLLIDWVSQDTIGRKFKIKFAYLDKANVDAITAASTTDDRNMLLNEMIAGALTQTTVAVFDGQAGHYFRGLNVFVGGSLPGIILSTRFTPEFETLLKAKYPSNQAKRDEAKGLINSEKRTDNLALDMQIYPPRGIYQMQNDTRLTIYIPGYTPGVPEEPSNVTKRGWNNTISMGKEPELWMNAQGLTYQDLAAGKRRWGVVMGWNTHLDYDGRNTLSKGMTPDEFPSYLGLRTPVDQAEPGLVKRAMAILDTKWSTVPLNGEINVVSHSTGYYLAMDMLHYKRTMWPEPSKTRYFAISPNIIGSSLIGAKGAPQAFDSQDDMYRDNWHWNSGYRKNENTRGILKYDSMDDVEAHVMLAYGDTTSAGVGGSLTGLSADAGVVDYTNYQPHLLGGGIENLDDNEFGRRHRFTPYESLFNLENDGDKPLDKSANFAEWENGGDDYLRNFRDDTVLSVFGKNVNLEKQKADDQENYQLDHSELAQRMMVMKMIVNGQKVPYVPKPGKPLKVVASDEKPGVVEFFWSRSPDQSTLQDNTGNIGGQLYEIVRRIEGNKALAGDGIEDKWVDKWWQRVALQRAGDGREFVVEYKSYETIRDTKAGNGRIHDIWTFTTSADGEFINVPTWLDRAFNDRDLWVRVLNGPLEGGFFKVEEVQDYVGIGYDNKGALTAPTTFLNKLDITLTVANNPAFGVQRPKDDDYLTLGGIKYQYNVTFFGPVVPIRSLVKAAKYSDIFESRHQGTGQFMSVVLGDPKTIETDTISPTISFGTAP